MTLYNKQMEEDKFLLQASVFDLWLKLDRYFAHFANPDDIPEELLDLFASVTNLSYIQKFLDSKKGVER